MSESIPDLSKLNSSALSNLGAALLFDRLTSGNKEPSLEENTRLVITSEADRVSVDAVLLRRERRTMASESAAALALNAVNSTEQAGVQIAQNLAAEAQQIPTASVRT